METAVNCIVRQLQRDDLSVNLLIKSITVTLPRLRNQRNVYLVFGRLLHCEPFWRLKGNVPNNLLSLIHGLLENQTASHDQLGNTKVLQLMMETLEIMPKDKDIIASRKLLLMGALYRALRSNPHFYLMYALEQKVKKALRKRIQTTRLNEIEALEIIQILFQSFHSDTGVNWNCLSLFSHPLEWYSLTWNALSFAFSDNAENAVLPAIVLSRLISHFSHRTLEDLLERLIHLAGQLRKIPNALSSVSQTRSNFYIFVIFLDAISQKQYAKVGFTNRDQKTCLQTLRVLSELEWGYKSISSSWSTLDFIFVVVLTRGKNMIAPYIESVGHAIHRFKSERKELKNTLLSGIPLSYALLLIKQMLKLEIQQQVSSNYDSQVIPFTSSTMEQFASISNSCLFLFHFLRQDSQKSPWKQYMLQLSLYNFLFADLFSKYSSESPAITEKETIMIHLDCIFNFALLPVFENDLRDILCSRLQLYEESAKELFLASLFSIIKNNIVANLDNSCLLFKASIGLLPFLTELQQRVYLEQSQLTVDTFPKDYQNTIILLVTNQLSTLPYSSASSLLAYWASLLIPAAR
ncbi:hypothetical protein SPOG_02688 [Schizosaccharomyces cryophilus OY26]|uniref:Uncharacterized protein n=1 Tax=Schizosaccharomyces cryophilus (strain OY26 / ATCC MYA-4695 / CBS 11777 / NBRC 106824 / NRRL Y48691) TaxID=653667 RepID=S9XCE0_SCHCR|nr:uncharacterized protein SPOG_02688 [Schizosaccharomyces cryophilus OY26]EPY51516.1 hypothetical protein SPOG_02688 [Schizosaccharomyces cryophilus OY26]